MPRVPYSILWLAQMRWLDSGSKSLSSMVYVPLVRSRLVPVSKAERYSCLVGKLAAKNSSVRPTLVGHVSPWQPHYVVTTTATRCHGNRIALS